MAGRARAIAYTIVALLLTLALRFTPQLPERKPAEILLQGQPAGVVDSIPAVAVPAQNVDTLAAGETLQSLLRRGGVADQEVAAALRAATTLDMRRIPSGMPVTITSFSGDSTPSEIVLELAADHLLRLRRGDSGWTAAEERLPWKTDTIVVAGSIASTLYEAMDESGAELLPVAARRQLAWTLADVFEYRLDMSRDLQQGNRFRVMAERSVAPNGVVRMGRVIAAAFELSGDTLEAVRFKSRSVGGDYFDRRGRSLRAAFLRAPLEFRRISSRFGIRVHPILGIRKAHKGTDYAASSGTPVRSVGDGTVIRAGWGGGYGNVLEIRHRNGYVTRYAHLRRFARGVRPGTRVGIGQTVAYVGTTGLSTAPHLHFEVLVGGVQRDPRVALNIKGGQPIPASERAEFSLLRERMIASLDSARTGIINLALR